MTTPDRQHGLGEMLSADQMIALDKALTALCKDWGHPEDCACDFDDQGDLPNLCGDMQDSVWRIARTTLDATAVRS